MTKKKILLKNQKGQGVLEYIILTGLIGIFCLAAVKKFGKSLDTRINQIDRKVKRELIIR
ncbi:MAG: hypothetical protein QF441_04350 [Bacteriovoracaceae bacterium]|jgi:Flp pilus assembly pilin Flp|nr:hypothetical protein [Halobacteriovoraceae bacterium]MDP7319812.1 hypothetical protein [Bacteriovoracaceae bacterium]|tara:strand:+ start:229 stop:408 length:180 start_codon:yes stop_codon:yes gene_type:complete